MSYDFADRLIEMRKSKDLSQEELAKRLGVSRQAISKWERAESTPDIANLLALADLYDTTLDNLVRGANVEDAEVSTTAPHASNETIGVDDIAVTTSGPTMLEGSFPPPPDDAEPIRPPMPAASAPNPTPTTATPAPTDTVPQTTPANISASTQTAAFTASPAPALNPVTDSTSTPNTVPMPQSATPQPATQLEKNPILTFPYPIFVVLVYLILGFCFNLWHPGWVIFFTIPFYYWIVSVIKHDPEYIARHTVPRQ